MFIIFIYHVHHTHLSCSPYPFIMFTILIHHVHYIHFSCSHYSFFMFTIIAEEARRRQRRPTGQRANRQEPETSFQTHFFRKYSRNRRRKHKREHCVHSACCRRCLNMEINTSFYNNEQRNVNEYGL